MYHVLGSVELCSEHDLHTGGSTPCLVQPKDKANPLTTSKKMEELNDSAKILKHYLFDENTPGLAYSKRAWA